jgi:hypothetical protein
MILFKENQAKELKVEFTQIEPALRKLLIEMAQWVTSKGHKFVITDLLSEKLEDEKLKRVSKSHQEGRAADIRVRDWPKDFRKLFEEYFEKRYSHIAAISKKSGTPNLIEIHDNGNGIHCHIQVRKQKKD